MPRAQLPHVLPLDHSAQGLEEHVNVGTRSVVTDYLKIQSDAITRVYKMENFVGKRKLRKIKSGIGTCGVVQWRAAFQRVVTLDGMRVARITAMTKGALCLFLSL